jgi:hypothetical protein
MNPMNTESKKHGIISMSATRLGLILGVPLALVIGVQAVTWAATKTWTSGETLTAADLNNNFAEKADIAQEAWKTPTFENSWTNDANNVHYDAGYYKDSLGIVHLRGNLKNLAGSNTGVGTNAFTLPAGYRPARQYAFITAAYLGSSPAVRMDVSSTGGVYVRADYGSTLFLDGISFRAEQ